MCVSSSEFVYECVSEVGGGEGGGCGSAREAGVICGCVPFEVVKPSV